MRKIWIATVLLSVALALPSSPQPWPENRSSSHILRQNEEEKGANHECMLKEKYSV